MNATTNFWAKQKRSDDSLIAWLHSSIEGIEQATNARDKKMKQQELASYWECGCYSHFKDRHCTGDLRNLLPDEQFTSAPTVQQPLPEPQRKELLEQLNTTINRFHDEEDPDFKPMHLPENYCSLLSIAVVIRDVNIRGHGICGVDEISRLPLDKVVSGPERLPCHYEFQRGWDINIGNILGRGQPAHASLWPALQDHIPEWLIQALLVGQTVVLSETAYSSGPLCEAVDGHAFLEVI